MTILYAVQFEYKKYENSDCWGNDLHSMQSDGTTDHTNCIQWCNSKSDCAGFAVRFNTCYLKNVLCGNDKTFNVTKDITLSKLNWGVSLTFLKS